MKLYDCFTFFNELELLDLRLMTLNDVVDFFVLVEANRTHTGAPKEFIFEKNKDMFAEYLDKIIYVKIEDLPIYATTKDGRSLMLTNKKNLFILSLDGEEWVPFK